MKITVIIPTYRRIKDLALCLNALKQQNRKADEILLVVRDIDNETKQFLDGFDTQLFPLQVVKVTAPGQVAALNSGLDSATGDIIAITDDDAIPHPDWLERVEAHFLADAKVGGVGGRDWMYLNGQLSDASNHPGASDIVGKVQWFGRTIGNHHIGEGEAREVEILKGANMSYRKTAITDLRFDNRLLGSGAQVCNDMGFSLAVKRAEWKLIYDPQVAVDHYPAQRFDENQRNQFNPVAVINMAHNETFVMLEHLPPIRRFAFTIWSSLIGTRSSLGLIQVLRLFPQEKEIAFQRWVASIQGRRQAWLTWRRHRPHNLRPNSEITEPT
jgi:cellulose synthase/poly-beta-1,6-N-acetylglucosamine synthase-like glycosyltransferase